MSEKKKITKKDVTRKLAGSGGKRAPKLDLATAPVVRGFKPEAIQAANEAYAADPEGFMAQHAEIDAAQPQLREWTAPVDAPVSRFVPPVPAKLPESGDRVRFVLRKLGAGVEHYPKVRGATVTEAWDGLEKHPTEAWKKKKIGTQPTVRGPDGKDILDEKGEPVVPVGLVNLEVHLDGHGRKDHNAGHDRYAGHVLYDPKKAPGTWHWAGE